MSPDDSNEQARYARRWADEAWVHGWHSHALDVLDHAIRLHPNGYKLFRKRGAFYLLCPDPTVRDAEQGIADLRRACELADWRDDVVRWAAELLSDNGHRAEAREFLRQRRARRRTEGDEQT